MALDPLALGEFENARAVKTAPGGEVQVFEAGGQGEVCGEAK